MQKVLVICGPTCVGKTSLSVNLAKALNGEIINGDSMQVYKQMNIGTAKIKEEEKMGIPHHLFDIKDVEENFSVAEFQKLVREKIEEIVSKNKLPIIVGGTGLYLKAGLYDYEFLEKENKDYGLEKLTNEELYNKLLELDNKTATEIHPNNRKRIIRAIELVYEVGGKSKLKEEQKHQPLYDVYYLGLTRPREQLYKMIDQRVDNMIKEGLEQEARDIINKTNSNSTALQAIGYKEFKDLDDLELIKEEIKKNTRHFAKRQYTWFNNQFETHWLDVQDKTNEKILEEAINVLKEWKNG